MNKEELEKRFDYVMKKYKTTALGKLWIDFLENGRNGQNNSLFEANSGGGSSDVFAILSKLGENNLGNQFKKAIEECNVRSEKK